jgi:DNA mismatch endonuclease, patch repair protein
MKAQRRRDTRPERLLRSALHARGFRFRVDHPLPSSRRRGDIVFPRLDLAVFVDGCFWHGCPEHGTWPKANARWWREKIDANRRRDEETDRDLTRRGWLVIRVWEHEDAIQAAERVEQAVLDRRGHPDSSG